MKSHVQPLLQCISSAGAILRGHTSRPALTTTLTPHHTHTTPHQANHRALEAQIARNRRKLEGRGKLVDPAAPTRAALAACRGYVAGQLAWLGGLRRTLVGDACVAAVVLVRASWLPNAVRVTCTAQLRRCLAGVGAAAGAAAGAGAGLGGEGACAAPDVPVLLGSLLDRHQVRRALFTTHGGAPASPPCLVSLVAYPAPQSSPCVALIE